VFRHLLRAVLRTAFGMAPPPDAKHLRAFISPSVAFLEENKIKTAENGVCFYLYKFALQTFLSSVVSHFVAKQLKKSILKLKF